MPCLIERERPFLFYTFPRFLPVSTNTLTLRNFFVSHQIFFLLVGAVFSDALILDARRCFHAVSCLLGHLLFQSRGQGVIMARARKRSRAYTLFEPKICCCFLFFPFPYLRPVVKICDDHMAMVLGKT